MRKPHKHARLIRAWADGLRIQEQWPDGGWADVQQPQWLEDSVYRVHPVDQALEDIVTFWRASPDQCTQKHQVANPNLKLTFDPITHDLVATEIIHIKRSSINV